jgi:hypothetical protein
VPRLRLVEHLEERRDQPLTLVSAPAGNVRTTLVSCWLEKCDCPSAWLSLDEDDNDLVQFLTYLPADVETLAKVLRIGRTEASTRGETGATIRMREHNLSPVGIKTFLQTGVFCCSLC